MNITNLVLILILIFLAVVLGIDIGMHIMMVKLVNLMMGEVDGEKHT